MANNEWTILYIVNVSLMAEPEEEEENGMRIYIKRRYVIKKKMNEAILSSSVHLPQHGRFDLKPLSLEWVIAK